MNKFLLLLSLGFVALSAQMLKVNSDISMLDNYKYETPQGRPMKVPHETKLMIVAFEKDTGATVNNFLNTKGKYYLQKNKAVFIADIHAMPDIITKMFALPKMKKYKHLIYLHYKDKFQKNTPNKDDKITIFGVQDRKITSISYISNIKELQAAIEK
jgi:hypothetical protein